MLKFVSFTTPPKQHVWISLIFGAWIYLFLVLVGPFDVFDLDMDWRMKSMLPYSLIIIGSYFISVPFQNWMYSKQKKWNMTREFLFTSFFFLICFVPIFLYYKSDIMLGEHSFSYFLFRIYLPTVVLLSPLLVALRFYDWKKRVQPEELSEPKQIVIKGLNKSDVLRLKYQNLVCIKSADNYIEVFYLQHSELKKKVLRLTLKKAHEFAPDLIQTHRSCLANLEHFIAWEGSNSIQLSSLSIPVSDSFKSKIANAVDSFTKKEDGFATIDRS
jgi:hypothetical protein